MYYIESAHFRPLPSLPICNGFICGWDDEAGLPRSVGDRPSGEFYGAYYWVKPYGLRATVHALGVLDPLECRYGTAIWYKPEDKRHFIGAILGKRMTDQTKGEMHDATVKSYIEMVMLYSDRAPKRRRKRRR